MIITLTRDPHQPAPAQCTLGRLTVNGRGSFDTIEKPWIPDTHGGLCGMPSYSCIAVGTYRLEPRETEARGKHWLLSNTTLGLYRYPADVPRGQYGRSLVLIHAANWAHELHGCIAPGKRRYLERGGEWMVLESRAAMNELRTLLGGAIDLQLQIQ